MAILFLKGHVGPYMRGGKMVSGYDNRRTARAQPAQGQLSLLPEAKPEPLPPNRFRGADPVAATPDLFEEPFAAAPAPADPDAKHLEGMPPGAHFAEGKGTLGRGQWAVMHEGKMLSLGLQPTKLDAANSARDMLRSRQARAAREKEAADHDARIAGYLRAGKEITDVDLKRLGLRPGRSKFEYLSPVVQRLFGISKARVREAMGDALSAAYNDMGTESYWANPKKALANAARYASGGQKPLAKAVVFVRRPS